MHRPEPSVSVALASHQTRHQLIHRLDGRYGALDPSEVADMAELLVGRIDPAEIDVVIGIPEGGTIPAFAVAQAAGRPLVLATRSVVDMPRRISFREPHMLDQPDFHVYGLEPGTRALIVEDEITTGRTIVNAVRALRAHQIEIAVVGTFILVDHPTTQRRLAACGIRVEACLRIEGGFLERVGADGG